MENVEKFGFSTDKPAVTNKRRIKMVDIFLHNPHRCAGKCVLRHHENSETKGNFSAKKLAKLQLVSEFGCASFACNKKVCEKPTKF